MDKVCGPRLRELELRFSENNSMQANHADLANPPIKSTVPRRQLSRQEQLALKPVVQRLFIEEGLTFAEVQRVLQTEYNFNPTKRQFATLQMKWGLRKYTRVEDRQELLEKINAGNLSERGSVGNVSLTSEKIKRWKREQEERGVSTSKNSSQATDGDTGHLIPSAQSLLNLEDRTSPLGTAVSIITRQPDSPGTFRDMESLIFSITSYVGGMYDQRLWLPDVKTSIQVRSIQDQQALKEDFQRINKFFGGCASATELLKKQSFVEARKVLSVACYSVRAILEAQYPTTLCYLIVSFYILVRDNLAPLDDAVEILRKYIARMATIVLPRGHPCRTILQLWGSVDQAQLTQVLLTSVKLLVDVHQSKLGPFHERTVEIQEVYLQWRYTDNLVDGENAIRGLLQNCPDDSSAFGVSFPLKTYLANNLGRQGRLEDKNGIMKEQVTDARRYGTYSQLSVALQALAKAQLSLGKNDQAFASMREAVDIHLTHDDPDSMIFCIGHLSVLEAWTREWGWVVEAENIKAEIGSLVARHSAGVEDSLDEL